MLVEWLADEAPADRPLSPAPGAFRSLGSTTVARSRIDRDSPALGLAICGRRPHLRKLCDVGLWSA